MGKGVSPRFFSCPSHVHTRTKMHVRLYCLDFFSFKIQHTWIKNDSVSLGSSRIFKNRMLPKQSVATVSFCTCINKVSVLATQRTMRSCEQGFFVRGKHHCNFPTGNLKWVYSLANLKCSNSCCSTSATFLFLNYKWIRRFGVHCINGMHMQERVQVLILMLQKMLLCRDLGGVCARV